MKVSLGNDIRMSMIWQLKPVPYSISGSKIASLSISNTLEGKCQLWKRFMSSMNESRSKSLNSPSRRPLLRGYFGKKSSALTAQWLWHRPRLKENLLRAHLIFSYWKVNELDGQAYEWEEDPDRQKNIEAGEVSETETHGTSIFIVRTGGSEVDPSLGKNNRGSQYQGCPTASLPSLTCM